MVKFEMEATSIKPHRNYTASPRGRIACAHSLQGAAGVIVAAVVSLLSCAPVFAEADAAAEGPAIPPGQENLLLDILGPGAPLPDCELVDGQVNYTVITLTYACSSGEIEYQLAHRSKGGRGATPTDQFAITLKSGSPPRGFGDALISLVRARESEFEWVWPGDNDPQ